MAEHAGAAYVQGPAADRDTPLPPGPEHEIEAQSARPAGPCGWRGSSRRALPASGVLRAPWHEDRDSGRLRRHKALELAQCLAWRARPRVGGSFGNGPTTPRLQLTMQTTQNVAAVPSDLPHGA